MINTVLSNRIEELVERCAAKDFREKTLILVPDLYLKSYLQLELCRRFSSHTLFGVEILPLRQGVEKLFACHKPFAQSLDLLVSAVVAGVKEPFCDPALRHLSCEALDDNFLPYSNVHLFGLYPEYHHLFTRLSKRISVSCYVLSPCMMFWTDMRIKKDIAASDQYFDHFPLLANCGKIGRDYARLLEDSHHMYDEAYVIPEWMEKVRPDAISGTFSCKKTHLLKLQADLLLLQENSEPIAFDDTVQVHAAPTLLREVEALGQALSQIDADAGDIILFAPDIEIYRPYIQRVFDPSVISVYGEKKFDPKGIVTGFFRILRLIDSRWAAQDVLALFECRSILKKMGLQKEDVLLFKTCMERLGVYWGVTPEQKMAFLGASGLYAGTFKEFQEAFLRIWCQNQDSRVEVTATEAEKIGLFLQCIFSLYAINFPVPFSASSAMLESILENYFAPDEQGEYFALFAAIQRLKKSSSKYPEHTCKMSSLERLLQESLNEDKEEHDFMPKGTIACASLGNFRACPAKVIAFLGMNESRFPRQGASYAFDKHLFLEALISARSHVIICYQNYSHEEQCALNPSSCLVDLLQSYPVPTISHSIDAYEVCEEKPRRVAEFFAPNCHHEAKTHFDIAFLCKVARSPLTPYFQRQGVHLFEEKQKFFGNELATLTTKAHSRIKKAAFFLPENEIDAFLNTECKQLPIPIQKAYRETILADLSELGKNAKKLGILRLLKILL